MSFERFASSCGLELEPFQKRIGRAIGGPQREVVISTPRGAGKTTIAAIHALHHLVTTEDAAVYCVAASVPQARILYEQAASFARELDHPNIVYRHHELRWCPDRDNATRFTRHLRVLGAEAPRLHGLSPTLMFLDELQAIAHDDIYLALATALHKNPNSKLIITSTAAGGADTPLGRLRARALAGDVRRRGPVLDVRTSGLRWLSWELAEGAGIDSMRRVKQTNPASWITSEQLREQRQRLPETAFRRYVANQWVEAENYWLPAGAWQACAGETSFEDGEAVVIGIDIGGERADSAVVWLNSQLNVGVEILFGDRAVLEIADVVRELASRFRIAECCFDPWRASQIGQELEQRGIRVSAFPQHDARMIPASQRLYDAIIERRIVHPDDDRLNAHVAATVARHGRRGWRVDKANRADKIDAVVALAMALDRLEDRPQPTRLVGWL
ncbi:MAG: terminase TerL endonuclease subunit [Solirubrobacterales bacterium]